MRYFTYNEFGRSHEAVKHGIINDMPPAVYDSIARLVEQVLDPARERLGRPITITSGYRCKALNNLLGGADHSQHLRGEAADITSADNRRLLAILKELPYDQLIPYRDKADGTIVWIHVSCCPKPRRQAFCKYI